MYEQNIICCRSVIIAIYNLGGISLNLPTKNLCIYLKEDDSTTTFKAGEHIIPAGIGGRKKLPRGYVSDQMNNRFSVLEEEFLRNSHLEVMRAMHGPGKRGSKSINKRTASQVTLARDEKTQRIMGLSQMVLGEIIFLNQIHVKLENKHQFINNEEKLFNDDLSIFMNELHQFQYRYQKIKDDNIPADEFYLGYAIREKKVKWYLSSSIDISKEILKEQIKLWIENQHRIVIGRIDSFTPQIGLKYRMNIPNILRVSAKIIFNYLAEIKGRDFVLASEFDKLRTWIVNGIGKAPAYAAGPDEIPEFFRKINISKRAHSIFISQVDNRLVGILYLYGGFISILVVISENHHKSFGDLEGFICDWENERETTFLQTISTNSKMQAETSFEIK